MQKKQYLCRLIINLPKFAAKTVNKLNKNIQLCQKHYL